MMATSKLRFRGGCRTTAMGIMPHTDVDKALRLTLGLDIPFWAQLPKASFCEDMYVQASEHFPGIAVDFENKKITFDSARFQGELASYSRKMAEPETFTLSQSYSAVYHRFLAQNLENHFAIRGQLIGPVSFGFRVTDENNRPIIYDEEVKTILFDFIQRKANAQYQELKQRNQNAFVWLDEPGLGWVFSGLSGYSDVQAKQDYRSFLAGLEGPRALHLCANVNLPYLLELGVELLSFDAYQMEIMPKGYASSVAGFIGSGGAICWGIVPTDSTNLSRETPETLAGLLLDYWKIVSDNTGLPVRRLAEQALIAPSRCCLKNIGQVGAPDTSANCIAEEIQAAGIEERLVERAFAYLAEVSKMLRDKFGL